MTLAELPTFPLYLGSPTSSVVPAEWPASLAGRNLMLETGGDSALFPAGSNAVKSVPLQRQQFDSGDRPSEATLNPDSAWRRTIDSWHKGAGQDHYDRVDSNPFRFEASKGINPWDDWSIHLLPDVVQSVSSAQTNLKVVAVNSRLLYVSGATIGYLTALDPPAGGSVTITGSPGSFTDITTDGTNVYATDGSNIWRFAWNASSTGAAWSTVDADLLAFVNGRLMGSKSGAIFYLDASGASTSVSVAATLPSGWACVGFAEGPSAIYAAGYVGDRSTIFRIGIREDGTGLDVAVPAAVLPDGEQVLTISSYLGFVFIGTADGVRFATPDTDGNLTVGAKLESGPARCFEPQGSFVWFGWDAFDATSTGLGRVDLREFANAGALAPAYASDLMVTAQSAVTSVATFLDRRVLAVSGLGIYAESDEVVASGWFTSGEIGYGLVEPKNALSVEVLAERYAGGVSVEVSTDGGTLWNSLGSRVDDTPFNAQGTRARALDLRVTLTRDGDDETVDPLVTAVLLNANPAVSSSRLVTAAFVLHSEVDPYNDGRTRALDVEFELQNIQELNDTRQPVIYQQGSRTRTVTVEDHEFRLHGFDSDGREQGTVMVEMREVAL